MVAEAGDDRGGQTIVAPSGPRAMGQNPQRLDAEIQPGSVCGDLEIGVDVGITRRDPAQRPGRPGLLGLPQLAVVEGPYQRITGRCAPPHQLVLGGGPPAGEWSAEGGDQCRHRPSLRRLGSAFSPVRWAVCIFSGPGYAEDPTFVELLLPLVPHRSVLGTPTEDVERSVGPNFEVCRFIERCAPFDEGSPAAPRGLLQGPFPDRTVDECRLAEPIVEEPHAAVLRWKLHRVVEDDARPGPVKYRTGDRRRGEMILAAPVRAPGVPPSVVGAVEGGEHTISLVLVVICPLPVESAVKGDVPGVAESTG